MPQSLTYILLAFALVLPMLGAIVLRVMAPRLAPFQLYGAAALLFGVAFVSVLALARSNVSSLQIGRLSLLLPVAAPAEQDVALPPLTIMPAPAAPSAPSAAPQPTEVASPTPAPTETSAPSATALLTAEPPTAVPPTPVPPTPVPPTPVPPTPAPPPPAERRTYTVQPGDTLRGIAEKFNVSVQALIDANKLTPEEADSLHIGQELVIP